MKIRLFLCLLAAMLVIVSARAADRQPNIIFVLADDLGYTDLGVQGSKYYETPNIDRLAAEGMRLTNFHQCQNCAPSRAAMMSGQYPARTGIYTVGGIDRFQWQTRPLRPVDNVTLLPLDKITIAQTLKQAGYVTAMFGKWHLGDDPAHFPAARGFDEAIVSAGKHFDFATNPPQQDVPKGIYLADYLTNHAIKFIDENRDRPFFLYLPHYGVHAPLQAKQDLMARFKDKPGVGGHSNPTYAAMIYSVDESVGRIMQELDKLKLADNTILIFSSDNGGVGGYAREGLGSSFIKARPSETTDNAPLRSGKGSLYEGGLRVPFIVRWPGVIKPGTVSDIPAINVDLYPTLAAMADAALPKDYPLDGVSLLPVFRDDTAVLPRQAIFQNFPGYIGAGRERWRATPVSLIQKGDFKLMQFLEDGHLELYNLKDDIGETKNLVSQMPEKAAELKADLLAWKDAIHAPQPTKNEKILPWNDKPVRVKTPDGD